MKNKYIKQLHAQCIEAASNAADVDDAQVLLFITSIQDIIIESLLESIEDNYD